MVNIASGGFIHASRYPTYILLHWPSRILIERHETATLATLDFLCKIIVRPNACNYNEFRCRSVFTVSWLVAPRSIKMLLDKKFTVAYFLKSITTFVMTLNDLQGSFEGHECENRLYLLAYWCEIDKWLLYETLTGSQYRTFRICTHNLNGVISRSQK